ncbi:MAG: cytochrome c biogenesis protein ResB, partial [bacterium]
SMKFAIIVLTLLAVVSVLSMFIGEFYPVKEGGPGWQEFWRQKLGISPAIYEILLFLKLHDPYRSWWYQLLLMTLSLSLFTCIIERIPIALRSLKIGEPKSVDEIGGRSSGRNFTAAGNPEQVMKRLPRLFRYRTEQATGEWRIAGGHGLIAGFGPILAHSGLLALVVGGLLASLLGFSTSIQGVPGEVVTDPGIPFAVRVDSFKIMYYPLGIGQYVLMDERFLGKIVARKGDDLFLVETQSHDRTMTTSVVESSRLRNKFDIEMDKGNIRDYISVLTVIEDSQAVNTHRVEVNHPMRYQGFRFYQTSFDPSHPIVEAELDSVWVAVRSLLDSTQVDTILLRSDGSQPLPDGSELHLARFLPDFRLEGSTAVSASSELLNPALQFEVRRRGEKLYHQWSFLRTEFAHTDPAAAYSFKALDIFGFRASESYPTVLQVKKNPGYWLFWLGFALATLGLILAFYLIPQRLWLVLKARDDGNTEVVIAGQCTRNPDIFSRKMDGWVKRLQRTR